MAVPAAREANVYTGEDLLMKDETRLSPLALHERAPTGALFLPASTTLGVPAARDASVYTRVDSIRKTR
jgi:hypothetical protein